MDSNTRGKNSKKNEGDYVKIDVDVIHTLRKCGVKNGNEIILFCKILSLSKNQNGACTAGNEYLANVIGVSERSVQDYIRNLKKLGVIKTFEQKVGCKTTTRYIYPQNIKDIAHEEVCDKYVMDNHTKNHVEGHAEPRTQYVTDHTKDYVPTTRRLTSKDTQDHVKPHEDLRQTTRRGLHPILEYNRIDKNIYSGSYEPDVAADAAPCSAAATHIKINTEEIILDSPEFDEKNMKEIIQRDFQRKVHDMDPDETYDDIKEDMISEYMDPNGYYKCNPVSVESYISGLFESFNDRR